MPIAEKIKNGDIKAFEIVFREYYAPLTLFANSMLNDKDQAEEIVQDLFYHFWKNRDKISIESSLKSYLFQSIRNKVLKHVRHENVKQKYAEHFLEQSAGEQANISMSAYELKELETMVNKVLDRLPGNCSLIFRMNRFEGLKYREIADKLNISVKTVESNMSRALNEFRNELKAYRLTGAG
jgi:RNA polymerase sigma-70 factor, ECF subfamily